MVILKPLDLFRPSKCMRRRSTGKFFSNGFDPKHLLAESSMSDEVGGSKGLPF